MIYKIFVQGSQPDPYIIQVSFEKNKTFCICNCAAGQLSMLCKHKISVLTGKGEKIDGQFEELKAIRELFSKSKEYEIFKTIEYLEKEELGIKKKIADHKKMFAIIISNN